MKKIATLLALAAAATLTLSGCAQQLSTSETCVELKAIVASFPEDTDDVSAEDYETFGKQFHDLADTASDTLSEDIELTGNVIERGPDGETPDEETRDAEIAAGDRLNEVCEIDR